MKWMRAWSVLLILLIAGCASQVSEQQFAKDPDWHSGQLANGFRYHLRTVPGEVVSLRLGVHVGSLQEQDDQLGYAHFLEHMAFLGSSHFQPNDVISLFEKGGATFGPDINAYTNYQWTYYQLDLANRSQLQPALQWFADIGQGLHLNEQALENEKKVVAGEFRLRRPEHPTVDAQMYQYLVADSVFATRDPIGSKESIEALSRAKLKPFYQRWYQPQMLELIVTGDIDPTQLEPQIEAFFGSMQASTPDEEGLKPPVKQTLTHFPNQPLVMTVPEQNSAVFGLIYDLGSSSLMTHAEQQRLWLNQIAAKIITNRIIQSFDLQGVIYQFVDSPAYQVEQRIALVPQARFDASERTSVTKVMLQSLAQLRDQGITAQELDTALMDYQVSLNSIDQWWSETEAPEWANHKLYALNNGEMSQSKGDHAANLTDFIKRTDKNRVDAHIQALLSQQAQYLLGGQQGESLSQLKAKIADYEVLRLAPAIFALADGADYEIPVLPDVGDIVSTQVDATYPNLTRWQLSNGMEVTYLRDKQFHSDIYMVIGGVGGKSKLDPALFAAANMTIPVLYRSGLGKMSATQVEQLFQRKNSRLLPFIQESRHGFELHSNHAYFEDVLAVLQAYWLNAQPSEKAMKQVQAAMVQEAKQNQSAGLGRFYLAMNQKLFTAKSPNRMSTWQDLAAVTQTDISAVKAKLFEQSGHTKVVIVADLPAIEVANLMRKYIAVLPQSTAAPVTQIDDGFQALDGSNLVVEGNPESGEIYQLLLAGKGEAQNTAQDIFMADLLYRIVNKRLYNVVREQHGLDYSPEAYLITLDGGLHRTWMLSANIKKGEQALTDQAMREVFHSLSQGVSAQELATAKEQFTHDFATMDENGPMLTWFIWRYWIYDFGTEAIMDVPKALAQIDLDDFNQYVKSQFALPQQLSTNQFQ
ncbi:hypothetical protein VST7929_01657 [Vibrio stylophorae]|uniref:Insulinase family protein n=1 Tax=Vibrio stylophorae TaxID=659351 RepID=A0ABM8ZUA8_9VIBR|nr:insulinase family protein [Vibrio stylophorae]CAH0533782.1 hypothetical protein VST7929_01657 [Vibrio stylophorae]